MSKVVLTWLSFQAPVFCARNAAIFWIKKMREHVDLQQLTQPQPGTTNIPAAVPPVMNQVKASKPTNQTVSLNSQNGVQSNSSVSAPNHSTGQSSPIVSANNLNTPLSDTVQPNSQLQTSAQTNQVSLQALSANNPQSKTTFNQSLMTDPNQVTAKAISNQDSKLGFNTNMLDSNQSFRSNITDSNQSFTANYQAKQPVQHLSNVNVPSYMVTQSQQLAPNQDISRGKQSSLLTNPNALYQPDLSQAGQIATASQEQVALTNQGQLATQNFNQEQALPLEGFATLSTNQSHEPAFTVNTSANFAQEQNPNFYPKSNFLATTAQNSLASQIPQHELVNLQTTNQVNAYLSNTQQCHLGNYDIPVVGFAPLNPSTSQLEQTQLGQINPPPTSSMLSQSKDNMQYGTLPTHEQSSQKLATNFYNSPTAPAQATSNNNLIAQASDLTYQNASQVNNVVLQASMPSTSSSTVQTDNLSSAQAGYLSKAQNAHLSTSPNTSSLNPISGQTANLDSSKKSPAKLALNPQASFTPPSPLSTSSDQKLSNNSIAQQASLEQAGTLSLTNTTAQTTLTSVSAYQATQDENAKAKLNSVNLEHAQHNEHNVKQDAQSQQDNKDTSMYDWSQRMEQPYQDSNKAPTIEDEQKHEAAQPTYSYMPSLPTQAAFSQSSAPVGVSSLLNKQASTNLEQTTAPAPENSAQGNSKPSQDPVYQSTHAQDNQAHLDMFDEGMPKAPIRRKVNLTPSQKAISFLREQGVVVNSKSQSRASSSPQSAFDALMKILEDKADMDNTDFKVTYQDYWIMRRNESRQVQLEVKQRQDEYFKNYMQQMRNSTEFNPNYTFEKLKCDQLNLNAYMFGKQFADDMAAQLDPNLLLILGNPGTGKTALCHAIAQRYINNKTLTENCYMRRSDLPVLLFTTLADIVNLKMFTLSDGPEERDIREKRFKELCNVDMLIIDDVCPEREELSQFAQKVLAEIMGERQEQGLPLVLSTPLNNIEIANKVGVRCFERINSFNVIATCIEGNSRRPRAIRLRRWAGKGSDDGNTDSGSLA